MGINGAIPNHPKKQRKNVIQVIWKVLMGTDLKSRRLIFVALEVVSVDSIAISLYVINT
jgi:hypothetical protein